MKIWHLYSSTKPINSEFANEAFVKPCQNGALIAFAKPIITRLDKIDKRLDQLILRSIEVEESYDGNFGIWLQDEKCDSNKLFTSILNDNRLNSKPKLFLRKPNQEDFLSTHDHPKNIDHSLRPTFLYLDEKANARLFEEQFNIAKQRGIKGVAFDIETFSRGKLVLAQKFGLETMLTGIRHDRHEKIALESGADHLVVQISACL